MAVKWNREAVDKAAARLGVTFPASFTALVTSVAIRRRLGWMALPWEWRDLSSRVAVDESGDETSLPDGVIISRDLADAYLLLVVGGSGRQLGEAIYQLEHETNSIDKVADRLDLVESDGGDEEDEEGDEEDDDEVEAPEDEGYGPPSGDEADDLEHEGRAARLVQALVDRDLIQLITRGKAPHQLIRALAYAVSRGDASHVAELLTEHPAVAELYASDEEIAGILTAINPSGTG